jgi:ketosteroid isomerase-like protein
MAGVEPGTEGQDPRLVQWLSTWEHWRVEARDFVTKGDQVVVLARYTGRGKGSGVAVDTEGAHLWTFKGGKARRMVVYSDRQRALEDAGIDPGAAGSATG